MSKKQTVAGTVIDPTMIFTPLEVEGLPRLNCIWNYEALNEGETKLGKWVEDLDDKGRVIRRRFERASLLVGLGAILYGIPSISDVGELLFATTRTAHPELTIKDIGKYVRADTIADIKNALMAAIVASLPDKKDTPKDPSEGGDPQS